MARRQPPATLSERDREILKDVILTFIVSAEPVSSRTVAKRGRHGLSAASIRNVMADLEEWGFLSQPHTSAGRVPTSEGYHLFIDSLMDSRLPSARERRIIEASLESAPGDVDHLMATTLLLLKDLSHQVSIVLAPAVGETVLRAVELVPVAAGKVLCVVVSASGFVDNKVIEIHEPVSREELVRISNYLTENFAGLTLAGIRDRLLRLMADERAQVDRLMSLSISLAQQGLDPEEEQELLYDGASEVLSQPELADIGRVRQLFETFSQKARLVKILNQFIGGEGVRVLIGDDSDLTSALDFSLVTTAYGAGEHKLGTLGIFGPSRMEYQRLIPLVQYLGEALSRMLTARFSDSDEEPNEE